MVLANKDKLNIEDYSVSQTTLDQVNEYNRLTISFFPCIALLTRHSVVTFISMSLQVFVNFAKQQSREDDTIVLHPKAAGAQAYKRTNTPTKSLIK